MQLGPEVVSLVENIRVIEHPYPLLLLGSDVLRMGSAAPAPAGVAPSSFEGMTSVRDENAKLATVLHFTRGG